MLHFLDNSCLLCIDIQSDYKVLYRFKYFKKSVERIIAKARKEKILIIWVYEIDNKNSKWIYFWEEMHGKRKKDKGIPYEFAKPLQKEPIFIKNNYDAFSNKSLNKFLVEHEIKNLYYIGLFTGVCVLNSIFSGFNLGYRIFLIEDGCTDKIKERHYFVIEQYQNYLFIKQNI